LFAGFVPAEFGFSLFELETHALKTNALKNKIIESFFI